MDKSLTVMKLDYLLLWLRTAVTLAPVSMDGAPGLVRVTGLGVGQLQLVKVRGDLLCI